MNRLLCLCVGIIFSISSVFAVQWVKESAAFEFPATSIKGHKMSGKGLRVNPAQSKKQITFKYSLPSNTTNAVINIYTISGARVNTIKLDKKSSSVAWNIVTKAAGTYTAELKTESVQNTIRFVITH